ncbi:Thioredoxin [Halogranum amylolyticum]|uniref:Thioredoxin n=1 Tax=Halogranum amylolyticum TaxID=660520 RepID=A0A1H8S5I8_9EURY|nr:thioredoxin domain-containing protein [Halogranum amylolyticum]SEO73797.1 Thioredoxin [Halogranum amylolyticum]
MSRRTRRALLRGTAVAAIASLAGCSATGSSESGAANGTTTTSDAGSTGSPSTAETTSESTATPEQTTVSSEPVTPSLHAASETTGFDVDLAGVPIVGSADATMDLYYWSDYQCPFCQKFEQRTFPKLVRTHVQEGRIRIPLLQFPNIGENSMAMSTMARCVWRQTRENQPEAFWNWHATVFEEQGFPNGDWSKRSNMLELTREVDGVDADAVDTCMQENRDAITSKIEAERSRGQKAGLDGTPSFILYNPETDRSTDLQGAQPYSRFDSKIQSLLE